MPPRARSFLPPWILFYQTGCEAQDDHAGFHPRRRPRNAVASSHGGLAETAHPGKDVAVEANRVVDITNRYGHEGRYDFAGICVWTRAVFERIPPAQPISYITILADWIGQGGRIGGVVLDEGKWFNIGSRREY